MSDASLSVFLMPWKDIEELQFYPPTITMSYRKAILNKTSYHMKDIHMNQKAIVGGVVIHWKNKVFGCSECKGLLISSAHSATRGFDATYRPNTI